MTSRSPGRTGTTHGGSGGHSDSPLPNPLVSHELTGEIRWLDIPSARVVVGVRSTNGHGGPFLGRDVTVDLTAARIDGAAVADLLPGTEVRVKGRLVRELHGRLPEVFPARRIDVLPS